jgi:hypothetical protein
MNASASSKETRSGCVKLTDPSLAMTKEQAAPGVLSVQAESNPMMQVVPGRSHVFIM